MAFDAQELRRIMGGFATGVTVITTHDRAGNVYGLTANAITSVSLEPPLLLVCVDRKSETFAHFYDSKVFAVNLLADDQEAISRRFAVSGGEKFTGVPSRPGRLGVPVLEGTLGYLECRIVDTHEAGDHVIHMGEVEHGEARDGRPLLYFRGKYRRLADV